MTSSHTSVSRKGTFTAIESPIPSTAQTAYSAMTSKNRMFWLTTGRFFLVG